MTGSSHHASQSQAHIAPHHVVHPRYSAASMAHSRKPTHARSKAAPAAPPTGKDRAAAARARADMSPLERARPRIEAAIAQHQAQVHEQYTTTPTPDLDADILVALRVRPLLDHERERGLFEGAYVHAGRAYVYHPIGSTFVDLSLETHEFDNVDMAFGPTDDAEAVYAATVVPMLPFVFEGGLATLIASGQTGAGKTHTMTSLNHFLPADLFPDITETHDVLISYIELYGDTVTDLLNDRATVQVRSGPQGTVVVGAKQVHVETAEDFLATVEIGASQRRTRATFKNDVSSRSHAVCAITFRSRDAAPADEDVNGLLIGGSMLLIVDLAGSERQSDQEHHDAIRIKETQVTNKSLMTLKECIRNRYLASQNTGKHVHIPFRTSKLTLLLKEALDPTSSLQTRTLMIGHLAPALADSQHSLNTARYVSNLKASSLDHAQTSVTRTTGAAQDQGATAAAVNHPSKWTYKQLCRKIAQWSMNTIKFEKIIAFKTEHDDGLTSVERKLQGIMGDMPPWLQLYQMPLSVWVKECAKQGVTEKTATKTWEQYRVAVAAGRKQDTAKSESTGVLLVH
ncbi:hypothetical protein AMAG_13189 [Allomyces macrogynus ATCC 38327]|uniref:Kinesin-like protein n=1 Tax=Allomyces macrogynus (strain ATCC 38327) TaxID=578462 RepID=A0A0L0T045_ALLM3|nr:hypothetical protein AMAG_13189 [Allomyces macrogynus ATCC 38327]|eukprot:KNE68015.1 hypothetical protein AMAG_13189 [Allomyces macrogynus ATCC 38327]